MRTKGEALAEAEQIFGPIAPEDRTVLCDDCWKKMMCAMPPPGVGSA
jgi:hypothetical protein